MQHRAYTFQAAGWRGRCCETDKPTVESHAKAKTVKTEKSQNSQNHNFLDENQKTLMKGEYKDEGWMNVKLYFRLFKKKKKKKKTVMKIGKMNCL